MRVLDDVLDLNAGDQLVVDGMVLAGELEVDESLVSGEAEPVTKHSGEDVLSGSFVVAGSGRAGDTRVRNQSFAQSLAEQARLHGSALRAEDRINHILCVSDLGHPAHRSPGDNSFGPLRAAC